MEVFIIVNDKNQVSANQIFVDKNAAEKVAYEMNVRVQSRVNTWLDTYYTVRALTLK